MPLDKLYAKENITYLSFKNIFSFRGVQPFARLGSPCETCDDHVFDEPIQYRCVDNLCKVLYNSSEATTGLPAETGGSFCLAALHVLHRIYYTSYTSQSLSVKQSQGISIILIT